ncbi:hypothetical protein DPSP01_011798 [Paraphaeosphaeria sporulosa]|uniref:Mitochondrial export protein Som1 n=1 Tax=Paraphaeosphaeria sporulosa TaxID=1460663 RepID=A0A177CHJ5_9PLEO|nr:uncharacterized protein CC84DRAFT_1164625 [Paraphaeosphaeria sporulosa]OAG06329.1 hypothetical protein CC84DRAFT_1164625 [Paraphaeosphaeria sporulosa]
MAPHTPIYPASSLPSEINTLANGKPRKPPITDLRDCALKEMVQYKCNVEKPKAGAPPLVVCDPVVRLFRVCRDGLHVETTAWEGTESRRVDGKV